MEHRFLILWVVLCCLPCWTSAIIFDVRNRESQCLFEELHSGETISGSYVVLDANNDELDVMIKGPEGESVYSDSSQGEGKFSFRAEKSGTYEICFQNHRGRSSRKSVDVIFDREDGVEHKAATNLESVDRIERSVRRTVRMISLLDFQQSRYRQLNERHSKIVKLTNRRVKQWTFLECMVVVLVTLVQVYLLKKQFPRDGGKRLAV